MGINSSGLLLVLRNAYNRCVSLFYLVRTCSKTAGLRESDLPWAQEPLALGSMTQTVVSQTGQKRVTPPLFFRRPIIPPN